jgi:ATP/maltotriose-dependent transcriptional regulator MalT/DNA-binding MarR family transcriptional regulator
VPGVTVGERILVHLSGFLRHADAYECPPEMTQDGIADALGISRAHVALELKRLRTTNRVQERMAHVANAKVRRKVYALTTAGQEIARKMREHARSRTVTLSASDGAREVRGEEAIEALKRQGLRESEAIQRVLATDLVVVAPPEPSKPSPPPGRPFFGRDEERRALDQWLGTDRRLLAVIIGVAGIGKSAFLTKVVSSETRPCLLRRLYAHDDAHGILSSCADFLAHQGRRRLKAVLTRPAYDPVEAIAVLREDLDGCVLAFDDLQACPAAEGLLRSLLEKRPPCKILVASRSQPTFYDRGALIGGDILELDLHGLDDAAAAALLAARGADLSPKEIQRVLHATHGHPLALELFAASGLDAGEAETERFILETVLDGLDDVSEEVLKAFAILRRPARSPEALGASVAQLRRLLRKAVLQHREEGYLLHDLIKEFFLRRMEGDGRKKAHARAAVYWEGRGDALEAAYHRIEAGDPDGAAILLEANGDMYAESARAGDLEASLLRLPLDRRPLRMLAETQVFLGKFAEAREVLESILHDGTPEEKMRARIHLGRIANRMGAYAEAQKILAAAVRETARRGDSALEGEALRALGGVERKLGNLGVAVEYLSRASNLLDGDTKEKARAIIDLGAALIARGDLGAAKARLEEAVPFARKGSREEAALHNNLAIVMSREGDPKNAAEAFRRSAELALGTGEVRFASYALANAVDNFLQLDAMDSAAACAERALSLAGTIEDPVALSTARANLGLVFARRGEWAKAEEQLLDSVELVSSLGNPYSLATRYAEIAKVYEAQGRGADAASWRARAEGLFARLRTDESRPAPSE